jgi:hypothetical protein
LIRAGPKISFVQAVRQYILEYNIVSIAALDDIAPRSADERVSTLVAD